MPAFTVAEWRALCDVAHGEAQRAHPTVERVARSFAFALHESGLECDRKWGIRGTELAEQYRGLPLSGQLAVLEVCRRFWLHGEQNTRYDSDRDVLIAHGARLSDK